MIAVSDAWKANQNGLIVSESFVEITFVGTDIVFNKSDITRYTHEQDGCLLSGKLPAHYRKSPTPLSASAAVRPAI